LDPPISAHATAQRATIAFLDATFRDTVDQWQATLATLAAAGNVVQADFGRPSARP